LENGINIKLETIANSLGFVVPEVILSVGILLLISVSLFPHTKRTNLVSWLTLLLFIVALAYTILGWTSASPIHLFDGMVRKDGFASSFKILIDGAGILTVLMAMKNEELIESRFKSEFFILLAAAILGAHLLAMTTHFIMAFLSLELLSIASYVLAGYSLTKSASEGSLKYFLFGSVASAVMLYGFSILFGLTGTLDFSSQIFAERLLNNDSPLILVGGLLSLAGFLYKMAAAPMHPWAPDVYEAAPMPVVAFLSVVPKLAGIAILARFTIALNLFGQSSYNWQIILGAIALLSILVGNLSALWQNNAKRMMAYSSIAQAGFLLIGVVCFSNQGIQFMFFYAIVYLLSNMAVFVCLQVFEKNGVTSIQSFSGIGKSQVFMSVVLLVGLIALAGIPPTAGFTAKLFIFTTLWSTYELTKNDLLIWLLVLGLLNTVVSIFFYLKIPYYAFIKTNDSIPSAKKTAIENYLALILVVLILFLFIRPDLLMGWLNRINFVL
jgi:NADH-quinone oxidoreductase subunit N